MNAAKKPWWQTATALVTVSAGGAITGLSFVPGTADSATSPTGLPLHLLALDKAAHAELPGNVRAAGDPAGQDALLRPAIVNIARFYLSQAKTRTPAQVEALIWGETSLDGADHGQSCAAFASLTLQLAAQAVGQRSWVTGGDSYPWPLHSWADVRVDPNPASLNVTSVVQDARAHGRWHPAGDGYQPRPGDWVLFPGHVEVITGYSGGVLDTIGADSLPGLTINAHAFGSPLTDHGVEGFVDNGQLASAGAAAGKPGTEPAIAAAPEAGQGTAPRARPAGRSTPRPGEPGSGHGPDPGLAQVPGVVPAAGMSGVPGSAAAQPAAGGVRRPAGRGSAGPAAAPGSRRPSGGAGQRAGLAVIPGIVAPGVASVSAGRAAPPPAEPSAGARPAAGASAPARSAPAPAASAPASDRQYRKHTAPEAGTVPGTRAQQEFINEVAPGSVAAQRRWGVPASVTIAQAIEESAWGGSSLATVQHNLFGIKGTGPAGSVLLPTQEFLDGHWETVRAPFRVYHNIAESIADHAELLATSGYYTRAMADRAVPDAFAHDLTGVYATDPDYGSNLIALMRLYNLYRFDRPAPAAHPAGAAAGGTAAGGAAAPGRSAAPRPGHARVAGGGSSTSSPAAGLARVPGVAAPASVPLPSAGRPSARAAAHGGGAVRAGDRAPGLAAIPGAAGPARAAPGLARMPGLVAPAALAAAPRYQPELPRATATAFFATAKGPLARAEPLYRDVARQTGIRWELLAACDWMQCKAHPGKSPVHGEKLGTLNYDRTSYRTKSAALAQAASDLVQLAARVYAIDLTAPAVLSVRALADAFAAFRWGELLRRHGVSAMEFPYSVAGLTEQHLRMHWPPIDEPDAPDRPGARFRDPFGAVPVVLSLQYPATV